MAKHRIRRWLQFGLLNLQILRSIASIAAVVWKPESHRISTGVAWVFGVWEGQDGMVTLLPDACYGDQGVVPRRLPVAFFISVVLGAMCQLAAAEPRDA